MHFQRLKALLPAYPEIIPFSAAGSEWISFHKTQKKNQLFPSLQKFNSMGHVIKWHLTEKTNISTCLTKLLVAMMEFSAPASIEIILTTCY